MSLTTCKKIIIALLLLAFTSQTLATAAMICELEKTTQTSSIAMNINADSMTHAHHHMSEMPVHDMTEMETMDHPSQHHSQHQQFDCCKTMGHCLMGGCSFAATSNFHIFLFSKPHTTAVDFYSSSEPAPLISSLYRPPIFC